jgi:hypothetical protein
MKEMGGVIASVRRSPQQTLSRRVGAGQKILGFNALVVLGLKNEGNLTSFMLAI